MTDIDTVKKRMLDSLHVQSPPNVVALVSSLQANGSWKDIKYTDQGSAQQHLDRLKQLALSYQVTKNKDTLTAISKGLTFWHTTDPERAVTSHWWDNFYERWITQPHSIANILLLAQDALPKDTVSNCVTQFLIVPSDITIPTPKTGANLTDIALNQLWRGVINRNDNDMKIASETMQQSLEFSTGDGVQADFSYHFHDRNLYTGAYGIVQLQDCVIAASFLTGTKWGFSTGSLNTLCDFFLKGLCKMTVGREIDFSCKGRSISRPEANQGGWNLPNIASSLASLVPTRKVDLAGFASFSGNAHYWRSDFMIQRTPSIYFSVKTLSDRTCGQEGINGENQRGQWLSFGLTKISVGGGEYDDVFPAWNWNKLPGVTSPTAPTAGVYTHTAVYTGGTPFVGGVSNGKIGAATMMINNLYFTAKKSWFFVTPTVMVALGAGVSGSSKYPLVTTLNQCLLRGDATVNGDTIRLGQSKSTTNTAVITHDGVAYVLLQPAKCTVTCASQTGSWKSITAGGSSAPIQKNMFTTSIEHFSSASADSFTYAYAVTPVSEVNDVTKNIVVLNNTSYVQAVFHAPSRVVQAVFYLPGRIQGSGFVCEADQPCLLQLDVAGKFGTVSSPLNTVLSVNVIYNGKTFAVNLPNNKTETLGKSVNFGIA